MTAVGALALGAFAVGALAIGKLAIGQLAVRRTRLRTGKIDELRIVDFIVDELRMSVSRGRGEFTPWSRYPHSHHFRLNPLHGANPHTEGFGNLQHPVAGRKAAEYC